MISAADIEWAARLLQEGHLVVFPTETVYGLGANALDPAAVERIFQVKGRPLSNPLIVHCASKAMAWRFASGWSEAAERLADAFWPGPLTIVVPKADTISALVTAGRATVGLRVPDHPVALALIEAAGVPVAAPSANRFMRLSPTAASHVDLDVACILDAGPSRVGLESTVVAADPLRLLRPGMIGRAEIERVAGPLADLAVEPDEAPGQHAAHYQPRTPLVLIEAGQRVPSGSGVTIGRTSGRTLDADLRLPADPAGYAAGLYAALHEADRMGGAWIALEAPPETEEWEAVWDRLRRAVRR